MSFKAGLLALIVSAISSTSFSRDEKPVKAKGREHVEEEDKQTRGLILKNEPGYSVKNYIKPPQPYSPLRLLTSRLNRLCTQPEIAPSGIHGGSVIVQTPNASTVYTLIRID
jgi:hypothetical protein